MQLQLITFNNGVLIRSTRSRFCFKLDCRTVPCTVKKTLAVLCGVVDTWHWYSPSSVGCGFFSRTTQSFECGRWKASNLCSRALDST